MALGQPTSQISTLGPRGAWLAVDGSIHWDSNTHTNHEHADTDIWWSVDLGQSYVLSHMIIYNHQNLGGYYMLLSRLSLVNAN